MIITPAKFEDSMRETKSAAESIVLMLYTLKSMGYGAGINIFENKFIWNVLLHGERNDHNQKPATE